MEIEILKSEKNEIELKINNNTVAEILREYLNRKGIEFAAWRREHPTKPIILKIKSSNKPVKKEIEEAIKLIKEDLAIFKKN